MATTTRASQGPSLLAHGNDWPGRAIAAEARVISLEQELRGEREAYNSLRFDIHEQFVDREEELEESLRLIGNAYDAAINFMVLHEIILREYYERHPELPKRKFEAAVIRPPWLTIAPSCPLGHSVAESSRTRRPRR